MKKIFFETLKHKFGHYLLVFTLVTNKYTDDDGGSRGGALL